VEQVGRHADRLLFVDFMQMTLNYGYGYILRCQFLWPSRKKKTVYCDSLKHCFISCLNKPLSTDCKEQLGKIHGLKKSCTKN